MQDKEIGDKFAQIKHFYLSNTLFNIPYQQKTVLSYGIGLNVTADVIKIH